MKNTTPKQSDFTEVGSVPENMDFNEADIKPPSELEMLAMLAPMALKEGACLVQFKHSEGEEVTDAMILTLHEEECPIEELPTDEYGDPGLWTWNCRGKYWYYLILRHINILEPWPPKAEEFNDLN